MEQYTLGKIEQHFADIVWEHEPLSSRELVKICEKEFNWKKSTTYTVLKKMINRGLFVNENRIVKAIISKQDFLAMQSEDYVAHTFGGSLPSFLAAFTSRKKLSDKEILELQAIIDENKKC